MVFETLFNMKELAKNPIKLFIFTVLLSFVGIVTAYFLFPNSLGITSVAFVSLLLLPSLNSIFICESKTEFKEKKISFLGVITKHLPIFKTFLILTFGIFFSFLVLSILHTPEMTHVLFAEQLSPISSGMAIAPDFDFNAIAQNNLRVLYITFAISLIYGAGVIIMLAWNASVWGVIIGTTLRKGFSTAGTNLVPYLASNLLQIFPHLFLETLGYLGAAVSGGLLAMCVLYQRIRSKRFLYTLTDVFLIFVVSIVLIFISAFIEINI